MLPNWAGLIGPRAWGGLHPVSTTEMMQCC